MRIINLLRRLVLPALTMALLISLFVAVVSHRQDTTSFIGGYNSQVDRYGYPLTFYRKSTTTGSSSTQTISGTDFDGLNFFLDVYVWWLISLSVGLGWSLIGVKYPQDAHSRN